MRGLFSQGLTYLAVGSVLVLFIMNPGGFRTDVGAASSAVGSETKLLSGSGYVKAK